MQHRDEQQPKGPTRRQLLLGLGGAAATATVMAGLDTTDAGSPMVNETAQALDDPVSLDLDDIQGNIVAGFNKDHQAFMFVGIPSPAAGRAWLAELEPTIATSRQVADFNTAYRAAIGAGRTPATATWLNVAFSHVGLGMFSRPHSELRSFPAEFRAGMKRRASIIGDVGVNAVDQWPEPFRQSFDGVVIVAADIHSDLDAAVARQREIAGRHGIEIRHVEFGAAREDEPGHEHFGFRDGISQPGLRGFTPSLDPANPDQGIPGQDLLWPGEFVLGYPQQAGVGGGGEPGSIATSGPKWTANGSYLVIRRLRQDVAGFRDFVRSVAATQGLTEDLAGAKIVGRFKSGAPLAATGPVSADPASGDPTLVDDEHINDFEFEGDFDGLRTPLAAHIRKTYPRDHPTDDGGEEDTQRHRILRRGIPFGDSLPEGTPSTDPLAAPAFPHDRGLLFACYQTSISRQFEHVMEQWVNDPSFPDPGSGVDPVITTASEAGEFTLQGGKPSHIALMQRFVTTTGGEYFFQPSISALTLLAGESAVAAAPSPRRGPPRPPRPPRDQRRGRSRPIGG